MYLSGKCCFIKVMLDILFLFYYFSIKNPLLDHQPPWTSATSEGAQLIFSKNTFLKSECCNKKYEVCYNFLIKIFINTLSFYRSQNVLCQSKFYVFDQKFIYILCQPQTFCAKQKDDLHSVKLVFVPMLKFLRRH